MRRSTVLASLATLAVGIAAGAGMAQQQPQGPTPFFVGNRLGLPVNPAADGAFQPISPNVKVFGSIHSAESCSYDPGRDVIVVPNRGVPQNVQTNNAWVSFVNHDGSVHTARWIGVQNPGSSAPASIRRSSSTSRTAATSRTACSTSPTVMAARPRPSRASP